MTALDTVIARIPHPGQIRDTQVESDGTTVRFVWRGSQFRIAENLFVEEMQPGLLVRSNLAIVLEALLKRDPA